MTGTTPLKFEEPVIHQHPELALFRVEANTGLIRRARAELYLTLSTVGPVPPCTTRYVLVFEIGGNVTAFLGPEDAASSIESVDVEDGNYVAAFCDDGEELEIRPRDVYVDVRSSGRYDPEQLSRLIMASNGPEALWDKPHLLGAALV